MRALTLLTALGTLATTPSVAHAETFDNLASTATKVGQVDDLVWALTAPCTTGDDTQNRQCRILRDRLATSYGGTTLLVEADATALTLGAWDKAKKSVSLQLASCVRCGGLEIDGRTYYAIGTTSAARVAGGKVAAGYLYDNARRFADEASATAWRKATSVVRVDLLLKVPATPRWQVSGKDGIALDVVGFRVTTPCDGAVVIANPEAAAVTADESACTQP